MIPSMYVSLDVEPTFPQNNFPLRQKKGAKQVFKSLDSYTSLIKRYAKSAQNETFFNTRSQRSPEKGIVCVEHLLPSVS